MISYVKGDILADEAEALVNTVNCVGVMGRGIALQFKRAFPENFKEYARACAQGEVQPGRMFVHTTGMLTGPRLIINFPTKRHWRSKSRIEDIASGLEALAETIREYQIESIAIPPLGSGLGGLDWSQVRPLIDEALQDLPGVLIKVYPPDAARYGEYNADISKRPDMTPGRAALLELMTRYLNGLMDPSVSLLELHKLMYFLQEAGEPLRLHFKKAHYGPYAENLRHVLHRMEGHMVHGFHDGGDQPAKELRVMPDAAIAAEKYLANQPETRTRFSRVAQLVDGFESPFGLELLSTVHWIMEHEGHRSLDEVVAHTYAWNKRKKQFTRRQIDLTVNRLTDLGWAGIRQSGGTA